MSFTRSISDQDLREAAKTASSSYLEGGTDLTDAVVKAASGIPSTLTDEHVKRLCEMTYHETYERMFRNENGSDRLVSFDPPNAKEASARLRVEKVASATARLRIPGGQGSTEKSASAVASIRLPRPFVPANMFDEKTASVAVESSVPWNDAYAEARVLEKTLRQQMEQLKTASASNQTGAQDVLLELMDHVQHAAFDGATAAQILELAMEGAADQEVPEIYVQKMASLLTDGMRHRRISLDAKSASAAGIPNLKHPIAVLGAKLASHLYEKAVADEAMVDIRAARMALTSGGTRAERV
jgi:alkylhydroperoxidase/carboxymuconolactone decarboxylase family protein YurZ